MTVRVSQARTAGSTTRSPTGAHAGAAYLLALIRGGHCVTRYRWLQGILVAKVPCARLLQGACSGMRCHTLSLHAVSLLQ